MPISPGALPPTPTAPIAATAAIPRLLSPRSLSTSLERFDNPLLSSEIEPANCTSDDDTVVNELSSLVTDPSSLASEEFTTVDCSDCVRLNVVIEVASDEIDAVLFTVTVVSEVLTLVRVALIPATDVVKPPRLVLTLPKLALVVDSVVLSVLTFDVVVLKEVDSAIVEVLTPLNVELRPTTEVLTLPRLALIPVTELLTPPRLVLTFVTDELTLMSVVLITTTEELRLPRLELSPIWLVLTFPRLLLMAT